MSRPIQLRFVNELVGGLVLGCAIAFLTFFILAGKAQGWFEQDFELRTVFPEKGALDLQQGAEVRIQGAIAGRVGDIVPNEAGALQTTYILRGRFRDLVRTNSVAVIKKKFQVAGEPFVEITPGDRRLPQMQDGSYIESVEDVQLLEKMSEVLEDVRVTVVPMLEEVQGILANVNGILTSVHEGKGLVGTLLNDEALANRIHTISAQIETSSTKVPALVDEVNSVAQQVKALTETTTRKVDEVDVKRLLDQAELTLQDTRALLATASHKIDDTDIRPLLRETEAALRETRRAVENLQQRWPFNGRKEGGPVESPVLQDPLTLSIGEAQP
jgi:phospholipid/cholesterol/gamma-HCH transport system substrate-binding protein